MFIEALMGLVEPVMNSSIAQSLLMYFVLPLWLAAGFADYLCHRASSIETTCGPKESLLHLLQFAEMAVPALAAIFLEINTIRLKEPPLPWLYITVVLTLVLLFEVLPYAEELARTLRARRSTAHAKTEP
jgi:hypothetical protein